ncbi:MAG: hypothetical protein WC835_01570 [Candidatus Paceibacterota bacterium]|jgi:hypothetical protein
MILNHTTQIYQVITGLNTVFTAGAYSLNMKKITYKIAAIAMSLVFVFGYGVTAVSAQTYQTTTQTVYQASATANNVTCNSVILKGDVSINPAGTPTNVWFQYGTSSVFENSTIQQQLNYSGVFSQQIYNLSPSTTYYYRAVANNFQFGTVHGSIFNFTTPSCGTSSNNYNTVTSQVVTPAPVTTVRYVTERITQGSLVFLSMSADQEQVCRGDSVGFTIEYKNISKQILKDVVLRVQIPTEMRYRDSSRGIYSDKDKMLTIEIGTLDIGEKGEVVVRTDVASNFSADKPLVTSANLVYTNKDGAQEDVIAYALSKFGCFASQNGALAFFSGDFFPTTILGWLVLILIILILVLLSRNTYGSYAASKKVK